MAACVPLRETFLQKKYMFANDSTELNVLEASISPR